MESSSSSKRAKAVGGSIGQVANCLVDGCMADLSLCRDYHRRHKVCEAHSKTPRVTIAGREQRFCQQCSRFHSLVEFDEGKRSCRKRLDGHNRRRRKPQPDRGSGLDFSSQPRLVSFSAPQMLGGSLVGSYAWSEMSYNNQVQLVHGGSEVATNPIQEASIGSQPFVDPTQSVFPHHQLVDSDGALSLLSSATPDPPLGFLGQRYHQSKAVDVDVDVDSSPATTASTFHFPEGSAAGDSHQTLSFMWE